MAILAVARRGRGVYRAIAWGNVGIVSVWLMTRTVGWIFGPDIGVPERTGPLDLTATALEVMAITIAVLLFATDPGRAISGRKSPAERAVMLSSAIFVVGAVFISRQADRQACTHFDPQFGALAPVDGHSILPRGAAGSSMPAGQERAILAGFVVNCSRSSLVVEKVEVLTSAGDAVAVTSFEISSPGQRTPAGSTTVGSEGPTVQVPPTRDEPDVSLFIRARGIRRGRFFLNGVRIIYRQEGEVRSQVFPTNVAVTVVDSIGTLTEDTLGGYGTGDTE